MQLTRPTNEAASQADGLSEKRFIAAGAGGRGCFWPVAADLAAVPQGERVGKTFSDFWRLRRDAGVEGFAGDLPEYEIDFADEHLFALACAASLLRKWLRYRVGRLITHREQAVILGVSAELVDRAVREDFERIRVKTNGGGGGELEKGATVAAAAEDHGSTTPAEPGIVAPGTAAPGAADAVAKGGGGM